MNSKIGILVYIVFTFTVLEQNEVYAWGWEAHRYINEKAVDFLPPDMDFFENYKVYLSQHSTDPDTDDLPGYYHYIDIDWQFRSDSYTDSGLVRTAFRKHSYTVPFCIRTK
ncbi:MAG: hypothetical protein ISR95_05500 [Candidatus Marinimicrobia bacterium]|nr:hypothetical protein [Candidatus Neomarinimicrobiota bacterium]